MRTVTGPDDVSYRVDTYIVAYTPPNGRAIKRVTIVVRRTTGLKTIARAHVDVRPVDGLAQATMAPLPIASTYGGLRI